MLLSSATAEAPRGGDDQAAAVRPHVGLAGFPALPADAEIPGDAFLNHFERRIG